MFVSVCYDTDYKYRLILDVLDVMFAPLKVSLAGPALAAEMGGQHEERGLVSESASVSVQPAFHRRLL